MTSDQRGFSLNIDNASGVPKFQQIVDAVVHAVSGGQMLPGDMLPSVNQIFQDTGLARGTIVKALDELKRRGVIESVPNKGYFISSENKRVLLLLDTLRPFKQVIYDCIREELPDHVEVNMYFHHYNISLMEEILLNATGKYSAYIVMAFNHPDIPVILQKMDSKKLIVFDWMDQNWGDYSYVAQEFEQSLFDCLSTGTEAIKKYEELVFVCPVTANHPPEAKKGFLEFCEQHAIRGRIADAPGEKIAGKAFLVVDDSHLIELVQRIRENQFTTGTDVGIISFNDYPMKEVLEGGITVISPPFDEMARQLVLAINKTEKLRSLVLPKMWLRN